MRAFQLWKFVKTFTLYSLLFYSVGELAKVELVKIKRLVGYMFMSQLISRTDLHMSIDSKAVLGCIALLYVETNLSTGTSLYTLMLPLITSGSMKKLNTCLPTFLRKTKAKPFHFVVLTKNNDVNQVSFN